VAGPASKRVAFETARLSLARHRLQGSDCGEAGSAHAALVSAKALQVERVGIWRFADDDRVLRCDCVYTLSTRSFGQGEVLSTPDFPSYVAALHERRVLAVRDAQQHRCTRELSGYFAAHDIRSVLDAPILVGERVIGVVCHEQVGAPRSFEQEEIDFAGSVADMLAMIEEQSVRLELEIELRGQEQLRQQLAKLEAVGRLARAAAHDFNNALGMVMMAAEPLTDHAEPQVAATGKVLLESAELGARIARELLVLGRDAPMDACRVELRTSIEALLPLLRARFGEGRAFVFSTSVADTTVRADPLQIERILLNLCTNAAEAIETRGTIELEVRPARELEAHGPGWLVLEVRDDGVGMSEHVKAHLYEPYFTTKAQGTGVGLASVYGTVRQLGGRVLIDSEPSRGTRVKIVLPTWT